MFGGRNHLDGRKVPWQFDAMSGMKATTCAADDHGLYLDGEGHEETGSGQRPPATLARTAITA